MSLLISRAWHAEVFKRLYHSGSNAYYTGITWNGNEGGAGGGLNYWGNVENALNTAPIMKSLLSSLTGRLTIAAHSLGNMVVGEAIQNYAFNPGSYFMLNPAVPTEAYLSSQLADDSNNDSFNDMSHPEWHQYQQRLWSTDWQKLFSVDDGRNKLTWQGQFSTVLNSPNTHSFYSTGEEVLAHSNGGSHSTLDALFDARISNNAWIIQEKFKGRQSQFGSRLMDGNSIGGWGFNCDDWANDSYYGILSCEQSDMITPEATNNITEAELTERPFFRRANEAVNKTVNKDSLLSLNNTDL